MRELTKTETQEVNGAWVQFVIAALVGGAIYDAAKTYVKTAHKAEIKHMDDGIGHQFSSPGI